MFRVFIEELHLLVNVKTIILKICLTFNVKFVLSFAKNVKTQLSAVQNAIEDIMEIYVEKVNKIL